MLIGILCLMVSKLYTKQVLVCKAQTDVVHFISQSQPFPFIVCCWTVSRWVFLISVHCVQIYKTYWRSSFCTIQFYYTLKTHSDVMFGSLYAWLWPAVTEHCTTATHGVLLATGLKRIDHAYQPHSEATPLPSWYSLNTCSQSTFTTCFLNVGVVEALVNSRPVHSLMLSSPHNSTVIMRCVCSLCSVQQLNLACAYHKCAPLLNTFITDFVSANNVSDNNKECNNVPVATKEWRKKKN